MLGVQTEPRSDPRMNLPPLTIGPALLPGGLWLCLLALGIAAAVHAGMRKAAGLPNERDPWLPLAGVAALGARTGFVAMYWGEYWQSPWSICNLRDGGWHVGSGVAALLLGLAFHAWRRPAQRRALAASISAAVSGCGLAAMLALALAPKPPERLPALSGLRADGSALALPNGQPTVLNLWASWCPPCRREMPVLADAAARHPQIRFVLLNQGEDADVAAAALREMGIPLDLGAWDPDARASDILEARGYPVTLIIDADGRVLRRHLGEVSRASLAAMLGELTE